MKKNRNSKAPASPLILRSPAYPVAGHKLFDRLALELSSVVGHHLTYARLASIIGQPLSTTHHWCQVSLHPEVVSFISLLERLPEARRQTFIRSLCRDFPSLTHARLARDEGSLGWLKFVLEKSTGLTILGGHSLAENGFVLTALGHAFQTLNPRGKPAAGLDTREPQTFVPLESVFYFKGPVRGEQARLLAAELWPRIEATDSALVLLGGIWSAAPELRGPIVALSRHRHVVVADTSTPGIPEMLSPAELRQLHLLKVAKSSRTKLSLTLGIPQNWGTAESA